MTDWLNDWLTDWLTHWLRAEICCRELKNPCCEPTRVCEVLGASDPRQLPLLGMWNIRTCRTSRRSICELALCTTQSSSQQHPPSRCQKLAPRPERRFYSYLKKSIISETCAKGLSHLYEFILAAKMQYLWRFWNGFAKIHKYFIQSTYAN